MKRLITICCVVGIILAVCVPAQATLLLSDLLVEGATITSGDKLFSNFQNFNSSAAGSGALPVIPADVTVSAYQNLTNLEYGLLFQSTKFVVASSTGISSQSTSFEYIVQPTLPGYLISDNTLTMVGTVIAGSITISETAKSWPDETPLATKMTIMMPGISLLTDHVVYPTAVSAVHVYKSISLVNNASLAAFTQTFSQVPEPATVALLGIGALSLLRKRRNS